MHSTTRNGTNIKIVTPVGIRLREETQLRIINTEQTKIQEKQLSIQKSQSKATWCQVVTAFILIILTLILGITNYKLLNKTSIPNKAEIKIKPSDNYILNRTSLFYGAGEVIVNLENKGGISSGRFYFNLGGDLAFQFFQNTTNNIIEKSKIQVKIKLIPQDCFENPKCNEKAAKIPVGIYKLPVFVHCDSCEPMDYQDTINLCIFGDGYSYERCNKEYPR